MKSTIITVSITALLTLLGAHTTRAQSQFAGVWNRNNEKTDPGGLSINSVPVKLEISQDGKTFTVTGTNKNGKGEISTFTDTLPLDGSPAERPAGDEKKTMSLKWTADKKSLVQSSTYKDAQGTTTDTSVETYTLSEDGKQLRITNELAFNGQTYELQEIYDKQ